VVISQGHRNDQGIERVRHGGKPMHDLPRNQPNREFSHIEPLMGQHGDFTPELIEIDALLTEQAQASTIPQGLSERVFLASVSGLPQQSYKFVEFASGNRVRKLWFRSVSGQVAMAASVALAFGIALWVVQRPNSNQPTLAHSDVETEFALASALRPAHEGSTTAWEGQFDYLLETNELTSPSDITDEVAVMIRELEM
jgi:hypothetical protein